MADETQPQIYLLTPPEFDLAGFPDQLAAVLDAVDVACVRLALATRDEDRLSRAADALRQVCHARDVALVIDSHIALASRLGLDGVHLGDGARSFRAARKELGADAIVGTFCGASRHDGLSAGEAGADYVSFGPVAKTALGDGTVAERDLFAWWSEVVEVPVVAEGAMSADVACDLADVADFIACGEEIWREDDSVAALKTVVSAISAR